jgi:hypothetical protein
MIFGAFEDETMQATLNRSAPWLSKQARLKKARGFLRLPQTALGPFSCCFLATRLDDSNCTFRTLRIFRFDAARVP